MSSNAEEYGAETKVLASSCPAISRAPFGFHCYASVRVVVGLLLLIAYALKSYQLATERLPATSPIYSRWLLIPLIEFELALGVMLLVGLYPKHTWRVAIYCFAVLAAVSCYEALSGAASCGCFGKVSVSPWLTFTIDVIAILALWRCRPSDSVSVLPSAARPPSSFQHWRFKWAFVGFLALGLPGGWAMITFTSDQMTEDGSFFGNGSLVVLEPEKWIGKPFPLSKHIDIGDQLAHGIWKVVLYHHDCHKCKELIAEYESSPSGVFDVGYSGRVALIEMPPFGTFAERELISLDSTLVRGRVADDREWFAMTPVEIELEQGIVSNVTTRTNRRTATDP